MTLEERIADVLARLSVLPEAPAGGAIARVAPEDLPRDARPERDRGFNRPSPKPHHESSIPSGVSLRERDPNQPPPKERSLYDWYRWMFERHATEGGRLLSLYLLAEREYLERVDRDACEEKAQKGSITAYSEEGYFVEGVHALRVIEWYEGVHPRDVATAEGQTESWVRKIRRLHERNPEDGRARAGFLDLDEEGRRAAVAKLAARGMSRQKAADRLGIGKTTATRYWPAEELAAA